MTADAFADAMAIAVSFTGLLEHLDVPYLVGGSIASSVHGEPRSTNDIDIVADVRPETLDALIEAVSSSLDQTHLTTWAERLGVSDLLERATEEARHG